MTNKKDEPKTRLRGSRVKQLIDIVESAGSKDHRDDLNEILEADRFKEHGIIPTKTRKK